MSIGKINLFLLKLLNLFLALHQKCRTTISSFLFSRTEKRKMRLHRIFLLLKNNDWRRSPAEPPRSRPSGRRRRCAVQAFWPLSKTLAQAEFTSAEHCNRRRVKAAKPPKPKTKSSCFRNCFLFWWRQQNSNQNSLNMQSIGTLGESAILLSHFHQVFHHYHQEGRYFCAEFHCLCVYKYLLLFEYQHGPSAPSPR